jgi:molecular chaperone DnaK (HSP70)
MAAAACRALTTIDHALHRAGWRADAVDQVARIGGSALVPMFQRRVANVFPARSVTRAPRADVAGAVGTVLLTARFGAKRRAVLVLDVTG